MEFSLLRCQQAPESPSMPRVGAVPHDSAPAETPPQLPGLADGWHLCPATPEQAAGSSSEIPSSVCGAALGWQSDLGNCLCCSGISSCGSGDLPVLSSDTGMSLLSPSPCSHLCSPSLGDTSHTSVPQEVSISCSAGMIEPNRLCLFNPSTAGTTPGTELNREQLPQPSPSHQEPQT